MSPSQTGRRRNGESGLVQRVRSRLAALPIAGVPSIVVGVSGGVDSLALTGVLADLSRQRGVTVVAVHVDHRLRPGSEEEQFHVAAQADALGVEFRAEQLEPGIRDRHPGVGVEEAARRERYLALARVAQLRGADAIALAHHQKDQAESVMLHLLRGSGPQGISGMAEWSLRPIPWWTATQPGEPLKPIAVWRPLISETKATLEAYVSGFGRLTPIEDPSNLSADFKRNRIRHELLPLMEDISPGSTAALVRYAQLAAPEDSYIAALAESQLQSLLTSDGRLHVDSLALLDVALQRRIVLIWLQRRLPPGVEISQDRVDAVRLQGLTGHGGTCVEVGSGWQVVRTGELLRLEQAPEPD